jgi:hypothetical protein
MRFQWMDTEIHRVRNPELRSPLTGAKCLIFAVFALALTHQVRSESEQMPAAIQACRSQVDELQRLRCYDAAVDRTTQASTASIRPQGLTSAERKPIEAAEGTVPPGASARAPTVPTTEALTRMPMFSAKVAALSFRPSGAANVTLDNGQVWTQYGPEGRVPLRAGDSVTLRPGLFGASVLVGPSGWITKVHLIPGNITGADAK